MSVNKDTYKKDLTRLIKLGNNLLLSMNDEIYGQEFRNRLKDALNDENKFKEKIEALPSFNSEYQSWYSEVVALVKQVAPYRLNDFTSLYSTNKARKDLSVENYTIIDYLSGISVTRGWDMELVVGPNAAIPNFTQQLSILKGLENRFDSKLYDLQLMLKADIFDSELDAATELNKSGFFRAAGAMAGVVIEEHLLTVLDSHDIKVLKKNPTISNLNDKLKESSVIDTITWRNIQYLGDIRNMCDHKKDADPTKEKIDELISGTNKIIKSVY